MRVLTVSGDVRYVTVNLTLDVQEGLLYMSAADVTERHELETAHQQAEERFRVAFENSATGMAVVALTEEHSGRIVEANEELGRVLGVPRTQLLGMSGLVDFAHPEDVAALREDMMALGSRALAPAPGS